MSIGAVTEIAALDAIRRARAAEARANDPTLSTAERDAAVAEADEAAESCRPASLADMIALVAYLIDAEGDDINATPLRMLENLRDGLAAMSA